MTFFVSSLNLFDKILIKVRMDQMRSFFIVEQVRNCWMYSVLLVLVFTYFVIRNIYFATVISG